MSDQYKPRAVVVGHADVTIIVAERVIVVTVDSLRINQLGDDAWSSYREYLQALDRYDIEQFAAFLADGVSVQFNNDEPMTGKATAVAGMGGFWKSIQEMGYALTHEPLNIYGADDHYVLEALNHYDSDNSGRVTIRAVAFTDRDAAGLVTSIRVYQDLAPLYATSD